MRGPSQIMWMLCLVMAVTATAVRAETWIMVEARTVPSSCGHPFACIGKSTVMFRNMLSLNRKDKETFRRLLNSMSAIRAVPDDAALPAALAYAVAHFHEIPVAEKRTPLVDHPGVYFDSTRLDKTADVAGFSAFVRAELKRIGLRELTEEEWQETPGRPTLTVSYSARRETAGCIIPYSVSLTIKEEVILVRDPSIKISAAVWSGFSKENLAITHFTHEDALRDLLKKFVKDYQKANAEAVTQ